MQNTVVARIDLSALEGNLEAVRSLCPGSRIMAMVKADAYGHGLLRVAEILNAADGLAVSRLQEALLLRRFGIKGRILLLATLLNAAELVTCSEQDIDVTAHDETSVSCIIERARRNPLRVWLKLDSGMHRNGLGPDAFREADLALSRHTGVIELVHMTHFSSATDPASPVTERQMANFWDCHGVNSRAKVSLANSAALITRRDARADWVRPGIMLYGDNPLGDDHSIRLKAAMALSARVIAVRQIGVGDSVGYDGCWTCERASRIATVGIGFGDGYPRHARNGTPVWINGHVARLVGRVSMDSLSIDVTDCSRVSVGDEVILWGEQLPVAAVAPFADAIPSQLFTSLTPRVTRQYVMRGKVDA
jgi:alanine racemase